MRGKRWEYRTVSLPLSGFFGPKVKPDEIDAALNGLGHEGWELVNAFDINSGHGHSSGMVGIFKREK
mgnify:CR=1 FL=1